ncbi:MAG: electron transfer flavoprotein subunit beta/FixA family protein [Clostridia bacterium]|nr:electron transfer flavoprotein subunit beta/FixA family protein [Clostridia bacterium]
MRLFVLIKQVPGTANVKMDEQTGTMIRTENENVINPLDENALEAALSLRRQVPGTRVVALSMGPRPAMAALREAVAMGADEAVLLSDRSFAGSDTMATAATLAAGIRHLAGGEMNPDDLVLCGERATDGETGQVGSMVASLLNTPVCTYVRRIELGDGTVKVERIVEDGFERVRLTLPAVLTVVKDVNQPGFPTLTGKLAARNAQIPVLGPDELGLSRDRLGLGGSPTRVVSVFRPKFSRATVLHQQDNSGKAADALVEFLNQRGLDLGR